MRCGLKYGADYALYAAEGGKHAVFCALVQAPALGDEPPSWIAMQQHRVPRRRQYIREFSMLHGDGRGAQIAEGGLRLLTQRSTDRDA